MHAVCRGVALAQARAQQLALETLRARATSRLYPLELLLLADASTALQESLGHAECLLTNGGEVASSGGASSSFEAPRATLTLSDQLRVSGIQATHTAQCTLVLQPRGAASVEDSNARALEVPVCALQAKLPCTAALAITLCDDGTACGVVAGSR